MDELFQLQLIDELVAGLAVIVEQAVYHPETSTAETIFYIKRAWHPEKPAVRVPETSYNCAVELRKLVGTGTFIVNINDDDWVRAVQAGTAQERVFSICS